MNFTHNLVVAGFALTAMLTDPVPADDAMLIKGEDDFFLQLDKQAGESLVDFLDLASTLLDTPIEYSPVEVGDTRMFVTGTITVPKKDLRSFVEMMLEMKDFMLVEEEYGERTILRVLRNDVYNTRQPSRHWMGDAKNVLAADMESWRNRRALITTTVSLHNILARDAQRSLAPYIDERVGSVRSIENSNALVITAKANVVYKMLEVVQTIDIPSELKTGPSALGQRVSQVEDRLAALEDS